MKIDTTSVELQKILQLITFLSFYYLGISSAWRRILMTFYNTLFFQHCFIWVIPTTLLIFIKPIMIKIALLTIVNKIKYILMFFVIATFGVIAIIISTLIDNQSVFLKTSYFEIGRIGLSVFGWTLVDVSIASINVIASKIQTKVVSKTQTNINSKTQTNPNSKIQTKINYKKLTENEQDLDKNDNKHRYFFLWIKLKQTFISYSVSARGTLVAYACSTVLCFAYSCFSINAFVQLFWIAYLSCLCLFFVGYLKLSTIMNRLKVQARQDNQKQIKIIQKSEKSSINGLNGYLKLLTHFIITYTVDVFFMFIPLWVSSTNNYTKLSKNQRFINGIQMGSFFMVLSTFLINANYKNIKYLQLQLTIILISLATLITSCFSYYYNEVQYILSFILAGSILIGVYRQNVIQQWKNNTNFAQNIQKAQIIQKYSRITVFPIIFYLVFDNQNIIKANLWLTIIFLLIVLIIILIYLKMQSQTNNLKEVKIINLKEVKIIKKENKNNHKKHKN